MVPRNQGPVLLINDKARKLAQFQYDSPNLYLAYEAFCLLLGNHEHENVVIIIAAHIKIQHDVQTLKW